MCSASSTSSELSDKEQAVAGIPPGYVRISVGITGKKKNNLSLLCEDFAKHNDDFTGRYLRAAMVTVAGGL